MSLDSKESENTNAQSIIVIGLKPHPISQAPSLAEDTGHIYVGDESVAVNGTSLRGLSLVMAIQVIRNEIVGNVVQELTLHFKSNVIDVVNDPKDR